MKRATSDRKIASNRKNAQKSTGPRSEAGRERSRRNALRHGLAIAVASNPAFSKEIRSVGERHFPWLSAQANRWRVLPAQFARKRRLILLRILSRNAERRQYHLNARAIRASAIFHNSMHF